MLRQQNKGRLFFFLFLAAFFLLGGPALAKEDSGLASPSAVLRAKNYVYSGEVQYISLDALSHPLEEKGHYSFAWYKDGQLLSSAARDLPIRFVSDSGLYYCKVTFTIDGESAETVTDTVEIKMQKKEVDIPKISPLVYSGYHQYPALYETAEYLVSENEGALDAGKYFAKLSLKDGENLAFPSIAGAEISEDGMHLSLPYTVERAKNLFSTPLSVPICYEGAKPEPCAFAKFGEVKFHYYSDAEGKNEIQPPSAKGTYYVRAEVAENANVLPLSSPLVCFEIRVLSAVALRLLSSPVKLSYVAFDVFSAEGLSLVATMADGSFHSLSAGEYHIVYENGGDRLLARDTHVLLTYGGATLPIFVSVVRAPLDFSAVTWSEQGWVYDGAEREITLSGLPPQVVVSGYRNNRITNAGSHTVSAFLSYDRENYEGPESLSCSVSVERQTVPIPSLSPAVYSGALLSPVLPLSPLYSAENPPRVLHAGKYPVSLRLFDATNYCFDGTDQAAVSVFFEVLPMELRVMVDDVFLYLGEKFVLPQYRVIAGTPHLGDDLGFGAREVRGGYEYYFENPDYAVSYEGGNVDRSYRLPPAVESALFLGVSALIFITLSVFGLILLYRKKVRPIGRMAASVGSTCTYPLFTKQEHRAIHPAEPMYRLEEKEPPQAAEDVLDSAEKIPESADASEDLQAEAQETSESDPQMDAESNPPSVDAVDVSTANALITDALAEALVMADERVIYTEGARHGLINVDTLSAAFAPGEEVDINRLKKKKLIAKDVGYIKVLARGSIDKPLTVYADDFSLGAIKMIALTGGRTFHVKTMPLP